MKTMNVLRPTAVLVLLSLICYVAVAQEVTEEEVNEENGLMADDGTIAFDNGEHDRYKRAKKKGKKGKGKKKGKPAAADLSGLIQVEDCPVGTRLPRNCEPCPVGFYSDKKGLWKDCLPCEKGLTTLPEDGTKCVEECSAGMTWNRGKQSDCKKAANKKKPRCKNCVKCEEDMYKADTGNEPCQGCPVYFSSNKAFTGCVMRCPAGYEPKVFPDGTKTCSPCMFGYYKIKSGGENDMCTQCKEGKTTEATGATKESHCIKKEVNEVCSKALSLANTLLKSVTIKNPDLDDVISAACTAYEMQLLDICDILDSLSECTTSMEGQPPLVYRDGSTAFSLVELLNADIPCIRWVDEGYGPTTTSYSYSPSSSDLWYWVSMWSSGSSSGGSTDEDGMGWGDIANWITNEYTDGLGHDDKMDLSHVISSWFAKRDVHRRSLSGSGGPTGPSGKVCKPINDGSYVPPAAGYVPPTASYVTGSFMYIEQKKIDGGKPKGDGIKV